MIKDRTNVPFVQYVPGVRPSDQDRKATRVHTRATRDSDKSKDGARFRHHLFTQEIETRRAPVQWVEVGVTDGRRRVPAANTDYQQVWRLEVNNVTEEVDKPRGRKLLPRRRSHRGPSALIKERAIMPRPTMWHGSSDPFDVLSIRIDAPTNHILKLCHDVYLPSMYAYVQSNRGSLVERDWSMARMYLQDETIAYATLTVGVSFLSTYLPDDQSSSLAQPLLQVRAKSLEKLRMQLSSSNSCSMQSACMAICSLQAGSLYLRNFSETRAHGVALAHLFKTKLPELGTHLALCAIDHECERALMTLTRPCFDFDIWAPETFALDLGSIALRLPPAFHLHSTDNHMECSLSDLTLRDVVRQARHIQAMAEAIETEITVNGTDKYFYFRVHTILVLARALNLYLDIVECPVASGTHPHIEPLPPRIQVSFPLAVMYWVRTVAGLDAMYTRRSRTSRNYRTVGDAILAQLKGFVAMWETSLSEAEVRNNADVMLWILYIGAQTEWDVSEGTIIPSNPTITNSRASVSHTTTLPYSRESHPPNDNQNQAERPSSLPFPNNSNILQLPPSNNPASESAIFTHRLVQQAQTMKINNWPQLQQTLEHIGLYSESPNFGPHGNMWFHKVMTHVPHRTTRSK